jgi:alpha-tubulin suppressor-like RCC1 family protein
MTKISRSRIDLENGRVDNAVFKKYAETVVGGASGTNSGTAYTVDLASGNTFHIILTANCTFTFTGAPATGKAMPFTILLKQGGGQLTATWPSSVIWQAGFAPGLSNITGAYDVLTFITFDGGTSYLGLSAATTSTSLTTPTAYYLFGWGGNGTGELGLGVSGPGTANRSTPVQVGTMATWSKIVPTAATHNLVVNSSGQLFVMGRDEEGEHGQGAFVARSSPTQVGTLARWATVEGGHRSSAAIRTDGTLWTWGRNDNGELGVGTVADRSSPTQVGTLATWSKVSLDGGSSGFGLGIKTDRTLWTWGRNQSGSLGLADAVIRSSPTQVGTLATWANISAGASVAFATKTDGTLWTWGANTVGMLGLGDVVSRSSPTQIGTLATWASVVSGADKSVSFAVRTDGTLWAWGYNTVADLALGDLAHRSSPTQVGTLATWSKVTTGWGNTRSVLLLKTDGTLWSWGGNQYGSGLGDVVARSSPVQIGVATNWVDVGAGYGNLALANSVQFTLWSWGNNYSGYAGFLGLQDTVWRSSPVQVGALTTWSAVARTSGSGHAVKTDGSMWSWGVNSSGRLGQGNVTDRSSPTQVGTLMTWASVAGGSGSVIAIKTDQTMWSWGRGSNGALGSGATTSRSSPVQVGTRAIWRLASAGTDHGHAIDTSGRIWSWGLATNGATGRGTTTANSSPVQIGTLTTWASVSSGKFHSLALKADSTLWAWGINTAGQLGLGAPTDTASRSSPVQVGTLATWAQASAGYDHALGIKQDGTLWTWGGNNYGQLGQVGTIQSPVQVGTLAIWSQVVGGSAFSMAVQNDGSLWSWGYNVYGHLGLGDIGSRSSPVQVGTRTTWGGLGRGSHGPAGFALALP